MGNHVYKAKAHPFIHDISTDVLAPPSLEAAAKERLSTDHSVEYAKSELASIQLEAYPAIKSLALGSDAQTVFDAAKALMAQNGWSMQALNNTQAPFTLEAKIESLLFGFTDDVVVRIQSTDTGSLVDMRSMSRVGQSDMGMNAQRIQQFLASLKANVK